MSEYSNAVHIFGTTGFQRKMGLISVRRWLGAKREHYHQFMLKYKYKSKQITRNKVLNPTDQYRSVIDVVFVLLEKS